MVKSLPRKVKVGFRVAMASQPFYTQHQHSIPDYDVNDDYDAMPMVMMLITER